ncbi:MAG: hypothetical protein ACI88Z_001545, partial [Sphingobacteriales bacterium]
MFKIFATNFRRLLICGLFTFAIAVIPNLIFAQSEDCTNGIDDDGDGLIDCYDGDCNGNSGCDDFYFGNPETDCQVELPPGDSTIDVATEWASDYSQIPMDSRFLPTVGDLDGDGFPEVVGRDAKAANRIFIIDGRNGQLKRTINAPAPDVSGSHIALADVDRDGFGELFFVAAESDSNVTEDFVAAESYSNAAEDRRYLFAYNYDGTLKWKSSKKVGYHHHHDSWSASIADFNGDGIPEVYLGNQIFNAVTGQFIAEGGDHGSTGAPYSAPYEPFPVAADILPDSQCTDCDGLELICGDEIFSVDIENGKMRKIVSGRKVMDGFTSVADFDNDGDLDVIVGGNGVIQVWDGQTSSKLVTDYIILNSLKGGRPIVADFDNDGKLEIGFAGNLKYHVIEESRSLLLDSPILVKKWSIHTHDRSQRTGATVFDFQNDGSIEVLYRDEKKLFFIDGATGNILRKEDCASLTGTEYPIVVDVDGDGQAEVVSTCKDKSAPENSNDNFIKVWKANDKPWASARKVWNQHAYFNVNVNDDLTIPRGQQPHHKIAVLNNFLAQSTIRSKDGTPVNYVPDATITIGDQQQDINYENCGFGPKEIEITLSISNQGSYKMPSETPVSYYNGNPLFDSSAILIDTFHVGQAIDSGQTIKSKHTIPDQGSGNFDLFIVVNHDGYSDQGYPITGFKQTVLECDTTNNVFNVEIRGCVNAVEDSFVISEGNLGLFKVTENDFYPKSDSVSVTLFNGPNFGTAHILDDTIVVYKSNPGFFGEDTFTYNLCFKNSTICDSASVKILVKGAPVFLPQDSLISISEDEPNKFCFSVTDPDSPENEINNPFIDSTCSTKGTVNFDSKYCITYTPPQDFFGQDTVCVIVCDSDGGCDTSKIIYTISPVNDAPVIVDGSGNSISKKSISGNEDESFEICLSAIDVENDTLDIT